MAMSREAVARQFFLNFVENPREENELDEIGPRNEEKVNFMLTDLFFGVCRKFNGIRRFTLWDLISKRVMHVREPEEAKWGTWPNTLSPTKSISL